MINLEAPLMSITLQNIDQRKTNLMNMKGKEKLIDRGRKKEM
jgi:hypothetical protein